MPGGYRHAKATTMTISKWTEKPQPSPKGIVGEFYPKARPAAEIAPTYPGEFYPKPISPTLRQITHLSTG